MRTEILPEGHVWFRIAEPLWADPLDPTFAAVRGGRWNPPDSHPTLYLNEDRITARLNLQTFIHAWPYEPEDLRDDTGPVLVEATTSGSRSPSRSKSSMYSFELTGRKCASQYF